MLMIGHEVTNKALRDLESSAAWWAFSVNIHYIFYVERAVTKEIDWLCSYTEVCNLLGKDVVSRSEYLF